MEGSSVPGRIGSNYAWPMFLDDLFGSIERGTPRRADEIYRTFPIDVAEDEAGYLVIASLPGVHRDEVELAMERDTLTITVKQDRKQNGEENRENLRYLYRERSRFVASRSVTLIGADPNSVDASIKDGILTIRVKKRDEIKPKKIQIK